MEKIPEQPSKSPKRPSFWQVLVSVFGALIGVQSSRVHKRDFEHGQPWWVYVIVWLVIVVFLMIGLVFLSKWIILSSKT